MDIHWPSYGFDIKLKQSKFCPSIILDSLLVLMCILQKKLKDLKYE